MVEFDEFRRGGADIHPACHALREFCEPVRDVFSCIIPENLGDRLCEDLFIVLKKPRCDAGQFRIGGIMVENKEVNEEYF